MKKLMLLLVLVFGLGGNAQAGLLFVGGWGSYYPSSSYYAGCCGSGYGYPSHYGGYPGWDPYYTSSYYPTYSYVLQPQVRTTYHVPLSTPSAPVPRIVHQTKGVEVETRTVTGNYDVKSWGRDGKSFVDENGSPWRLISGPPIEASARGSQVVGYLVLVQHEDLTRRSYLHLVEWNAEKGEFRPTGQILD